ncbi:unnamed protein product, partial [Rotaria sp. Silwood1]
PAIVDKSITTKTFNILVGLLVLFSITTIVLGAIALGILINRTNSRDTTNSLNNSGLLSFADQIKIVDLLHHLEQLQVIADQSNGTRAIGTRGFNGSGTVGNLVLALNLARLFETTSLNYAQFPYHVRFC